MVVVTTKVSKGKLVAILLILAVIVGLLVTLGSRADQEADAAAESALTVSNNEERVAYLQSLGWEVTEEPVESRKSAFRQSCRTFWCNIMNCRKARTLI